MLLLELEVNWSFIHSVFNPLEKDGLSSIMSVAKEILMNRNDLVSAFITLLAEKESQLNLNENKYGKCFGRGKMRYSETHSREMMFWGIWEWEIRLSEHFVGKETFHTDTEGNNKMYQGFCKKKNSKSCRV